MVRRLILRDNREAVYVGVAAIIVAVIFSAFVYLLGGNLWEWFINLIATFISALVAVAVGIWLFGFQSQKTNKEREEQFLTALAGKLQSNVEILESNRPTPVLAASTKEEIAKGILVQLPPVIAEEAIRSGVFDSEDTLLLTTIARQLHIHNSEVSYLLSVRASQTSAASIRLAAEELKQRQKLIIEICKELLQHLEAEGIQIPSPER